MIDRMLSGGVIAVVRLPEPADLRPIAAALAAGGVDVVELTLTTPGALEAIADLASDEGLKGCIIGAGTVLDVKAARDVIARGARFVGRADSPRPCPGGRRGRGPASMTVITFGELLLRLSPPGEERLLESPVLHTCFGGAEANVAVALRHLGVPSSYITRLPESPLGEAGLGALQRESVTVDRVLRGGFRLGPYFVEPGPDLRGNTVVVDTPNS